MSPEQCQIALVIQDLYRLGGQYVTSLVAKGLSQRGYRVDLVLSAVHAKIAQDRPDLDPFPVPVTVRTFLLPHLKASRNILALAKYYRKKKPKVVVSMSSGYFPAVMLASRLVAKRPFIIHVEHSGGIGMAMGMSKVRKSTWGPFDFVKRILSSWCFSHADKILAVSQGVASALNKTKNVDYGKMTVIYNPVVDEQFIKKVQMLPDHPWLLEHVTPVITAAGAHVPLKGYDVLIHAFSLVRKNKECRLVIYGEGTETDNLKALTHQLGVQDDVSFPGYTTNLPANLKAADMFVVSSHCESFSVVLVEALACGIPVVATNCPSGPPELLERGKYGILVEPDNPSAMAEGIERVLAGNGIKAPSESWEPYTLDHVIDRYVSVIRDMVSP